MKKGILLQLFGGTNKSVAKRCRHWQSYIDVTVGHGVWFDSDDYTPCRNERACFRKVGHIYPSPMIESLLIALSKWCSCVERW